MHRVARMGTGKKEELKAMSKFGVYRVVKRSEASGRKLLTAKWVHKRKTNEKEKSIAIKRD